jgi:hypothetical protein
MIGPSQHNIMSGGRQRLTVKKEYNDMLHVSRRALTPCHIRGKSMIPQGHWTSIRQPNQPAGTVLFTRK